MARVADSLLKEWSNNETVNATDYNREREILKVAINDNFDRATENNSQLARHIASDDHDERYYTKDQINANFAGDGDIVYEVFTITSVNEEEGTFAYTDTDGAGHVGETNSLGHQIFTLQKGEVHNSARIEAFIDDTLHRSVVSGGLDVIDSKTIALTAPEIEGAEVTFKYYKQVRITGTHKTMHENDGEDEVRGLLNISATEPTKAFAGKLWGKVIDNG